MANDVHHWRGPVVLESNRGAIPRPLQPAGQAPCASFSHAFLSWWLRFHIKYQAW
jgi:hypothetical protein